MLSINKKIGISVILLSAALLLFAPPAAVQGSERDLSTKFTINHPFMVPGKVLEPNTEYLIRMLDTPGSSRVVTVYNSDGSELQAMFLAAPDYRAEATDETVFNFMETGTGQPKVIQSWFYPGRHNGLEFMYSKEELEKIAENRGGASLVQTASEPAVTDVQPTLPGDVVTSEESVQEPLIAQQEPSVEEDVLIAQNEQPSQDTEINREKPSEAIQSEAPTQSELPETAGELPLVGLIGALCLSMGIGIRKLHRSR
jgi:hypothetical protein